MNESVTISLDRYHGMLDRESELKEEIKRLEDTLGGVECHLNSIIKMFRNPTKLKDLMTGKDVAHFSLKHKDVCDLLLGDVPDDIKLEISVSDPHYIVDRRKVE